MNASQPLSRPSGWLPAVVFGVTAFLSAALLFSVEPMFTKLVLPILGGSSTVWTCCILFFQVALLVGYFYADRAPRLLGAAHVPVHCILVALSLLALPLSLTLPAHTSSAEHPVLWLLIVLTASLGLPFVMLSSSAPLLQRWHNRGRFAPEQDSYALYAASNAGSLLALLSYPVIVEPALRLSQQRLWWSAGYFATSLPCSGVRCSPASPPPMDRGRCRDSAGRVTPTERVLWIVLSLVPSSLFLALTTYLTTDIAPVPLLWVLPLALYLLSFILVFVRRPPLAHASMVRLQAALLVLLAVLIFWGSGVEVIAGLPFHLVGFFVTAMVCHGELARRRPDAAHLTEYYLWIAVGGALGGAFNVLIAPHIFDSVLEYPVMLVLAAALRPRTPPSVSETPDAGPRVRRAGRGNPGGSATGPGHARRGADKCEYLAGVSGCRRIVTVCRSGLPARVCPSVLRAGTRSGARGGERIGVAGLRVVFAKRNFFGVHQVRDDRESRIRYLLHGSTIHGAQALSDTADPEPLSYYSREGPVGDLFREVPFPLAAELALSGSAPGPWLPTPAQGRSGPV